MRSVPSARASRRPPPASPAPSRPRCRSPIQTPWLSAGRHLVADRAKLDLLEAEAPACPRGRRGRGRPRRRPASPLSTARVMPVPASSSSAWTMWRLQHDVAERDERARAEVGLGERERVGLARRRVVRIVDEAGAGDVDGLGPVAADDERVAAAERGEVVEEAGQDGPALDLEHGLGCPRREPAEVRCPLRPPAPPPRATRAQARYAALGLLQLGVALQPEHLVERRHLRSRRPAAIRPRGGGAPSPAWRRWPTAAGGWPRSPVLTLARAEVLGRRRASTWSARAPPAPGRPTRARNAKISAGLDWREWIRIASAPAA